jgi:hypothetical protein
MKYEATATHTSGWCDHGPDVPPCNNGAACRTRMTPTASQCVPQSCHLGSALRPLCAQPHTPANLSRWIQASNPFGSGHWSVVRSSAGAHRFLGASVPLKLYPGAVRDPDQTMCQLNQPQRRDRRANNSSKRDRGTEEPRRPKNRFKQPSSPSHRLPAPRRSACRPCQPRYRGRSGCPSAPPRGRRNGRAQR